MGKETSSYIYQKVADEIQELLKKTPRPLFGVIVEGLCFIGP